MEQLRATTILAVKRGGKTVIIGDGQVTMGESVIKGNARKVRRIYDGKVIVGFAGGASDSITLCDRLEKILEKHGGNLLRSAVELVNNFREDKYHRQLEAVIIAADKDHLLQLSGVGDITEFDNVCATGSGGNYALAAANALLRNTDMDAATICHKAMEIASEMCIYTNSNYIVEEL